jgi:hypothetical protein
MKLTLQAVKFKSGEKKSMVSAFMKVLLLSHVPLKCGTSELLAATICIAPKSKYK